MVGVVSVVSLCLGAAGARYIADHYLMELPDGIAVAAAQLLARKRREAQAKRMSRVSGHVRRLSAAIGGSHEGSPARIEMDAQQDATTRVSAYEAGVR